MYNAERITTVEGVRHIGSKAEFHSIMLNGHDIRLQYDTGSSVTIVSTKLLRKISSLILSTSPQ